MDILLGTPFAPLGTDMRQKENNMGKLTMLGLGVLSFMLSSCALDDGYQFEAFSVDDMGEMRAARFFPDHNASHVDRSTVFPQIQFSRPISRESLQNGFQVLETLGTNNTKNLTAGTELSIDGSGIIVTFGLPMAQLNANAKYTINVMQSVRSQSGTPLTYPVQYIFYTGAAESLSSTNIQSGPPYIVMGPARNVYSGPCGCHIEAVIQFNEDITNAPLLRVRAKGLINDTTYLVPMQFVAGGRLDVVAATVNQDMYGNCIGGLDTTYHLSMTTNEVFDAEGLQARPESEGSSYLFSKVSFSSPLVCQSSGG